MTLGSGTQIEIVQDDLREIVNDFSTSERFIDVIYGGQLPPNVEQSVLTNLVQLEVLRAEATELGLDVGSVEPAEATLTSQLEGALAQSGSGDPSGDAAAVADEIGSYFDLVAETLTVNNALQARFAEEADGSVGGDPCASHILVDLDSEDLANEIVDRLNDGEDFGELAVEFSIDPGSASNGGDLGCANPETYVPAFRDALLSAELDEVVGPVESEFGFHVIKVTGYDPAAEINARFADAFADVDVAVDPQVGVWDRTTQTIVTSQEP